jgi:uncharacterized protein YkwD
MRRSLSIPLFFCLFVLALPLRAAAGNLYAEINHLRASGGNCPAAQRLPELRPQAALERAARELAQGGQLKESLQSAGYRATRTRVLSVTGGGVGTRAAEILAGQAYCAPLRHADMTEVGLHLDAKALWIVMAEPFAPPAAAAGRGVGLRVLELVNQARASARSCGSQMYKPAQPLRWNDSLALAAFLHAEDMARHNYFSHEGRDGSNPGQRVERIGYRYRAAGENIAGGQRTPEETVAGWMKSPGHCVNVMNASFTEMGAAFATDLRSEYGVYWAQAFGTPR